MTHHPTTVTTAHRTVEYLFVSNVRERVVSTQDTEVFSSEFVSTIILIWCNNIPNCYLWLPSLKKQLVIIDYISIIASLSLLFNILKYEYIFFKYMFCTLFDIFYLKMRTFFASILVYDVSRNYHLYIMTLIRTSKSIV